MRSLRSAIGAMLVAGAVAATAGAQSPARPIEWRADAIRGDGVETLAGVGMGRALGIYSRVSAAAAAGTRWVDGDVEPAGRVDVSVRFVLDPFHESRFGISVGGGVTAAVSERRQKAFLAALLEVEGRRRRRFAPAVQIGLGGGARVTVLLRSGTVRSR
jgi:hypothetical protein